MSEPKTILIVDDDLDVIHSMKLRLKTAGYGTIVANSAESGIQAARTQRPEAIVMDVRMNDRSGLDAVEELKSDELTEDIPIVMLSGCVGSQRQALDKGARFFMRKPYRSGEVLNAIELAIEESHQHPNREENDE
jgi:CheY-like chemotaxis protein